MVDFKFNVHERVCVCVYFMASIKQLLKISFADQTLNVKENIQENLRDMCAKL